MPVGARTVTGIVVENRAAGASGIDPKSIKPIRETLDAGAFVPADVVALAAWTAEYYAAGAGETITAVLPPKTRGERADAHKTTRVGGDHSRRARSDRRLDAPDDPTLTSKQHEAVLAELAGMPEGISTALLAARGISADTVARLAKHGLISVRRDRVDRDPFEAAALTLAPPDALRQLTLEQSGALARLRALSAAGTFRVALLHGVTGSGKTEIYLRLAADAPRVRTHRADARAGDCAHARRRRAVPAGIRRSRRDSAQRVVGRRASRPVAAHPPTGMSTW